MKRWLDEVKGWLVILALCAAPILGLAYATHHHSTTAPQASTARHGAVCADGWISNATGRGACSWHGGVHHWITDPGEACRLLPIYRYIPCPNPER